MDLVATRRSLHLPSSPDDSGPAADEEEMLYDLEAGIPVVCSKAGKENHQSTSSNRRSANNEISGAAMVGGLAGLVLVGPVVGLVAAGGAAVAATTEGSVGDAARKTGEQAGEVVRKTRAITSTATRNLQIGKNDLAGLNTAINLDVDS